MVAKSKQERSKEIEILIDNWIAERDRLGDYEGWMQTKGPKAFKGVKRQELADELGCSKTALNENDAAPRLKNAEARWGMAYAKTQETSKASQAEVDRAKTAEKRAQRKASTLDHDNTALKAENRLLRARLAKWESVEQVLQDVGRSPRRPLTEQ